MTIREALSGINEAVPGNGYSESDKIRWLSRADGNIKHCVIDTHEDGGDISFHGYDDNTAKDTVLFMPHPYDEAYIRWMEAMIHYSNGEIARYNNALASYNSIYSAYSNWYNRNHMPKGFWFKL